MTAEMPVSPLIGLGPLVPVINEAFLRDLILSSKMRKKLLFLFTKNYS
jgi:hypothetical protein